MSKSWYPVIDYANCTECGACTAKCKHGVYDQDKAPMPVVVKPENCIHGCTGCGSLCSADAIRYVGQKDLKNVSFSCGCNDCDCNNRGCC